MVSSSHPVTSVLGQYLQGTWIIRIKKKVHSTKGQKIYLSRLVRLVTNELSLLSSWNFGFNFSITSSWKCLWLHKVGIDASIYAPIIPATSAHKTCQGILECLLMCPPSSWTVNLKRAGSSGFFFLLLLQNPNLSECLTPQYAISICGMKEWMNDWRARTIP